MDFVSWLCKYLDPRMKSNRYEKHDQEIKVWECNRSGYHCDMIISIRNSPQKLIVIDPEHCGNMKAFPDRLKWNKNCDFLMVGERPEGLFALLVELKPTFEDEKSKKQVRWSRRILHHIISMYNIDQGHTLEEYNFDVRYLVVYERSELSIDKGKTRVTGNPFRLEPYEGLDIYYQKKGDHSFKQIFNQ